MVFTIGFPARTPEKNAGHSPGEHRHSWKNRHRENQLQERIGESKLPQTENRGDPRCMESALYTVPVLSPVIGEWGNWSPEKISAYGFHHRRMQPCKSRGLGTFH